VTRTRGFTLLEILVALTLFAVVGGALLQMFQQGLRSTRTASEQTHAALLARSKLSELQAYEQLTPGEIGGEFDDGYRWRATLVEDTALLEAYPGDLTPLSLTLTIRWGGEDDPSAYGVRALLLAQPELP
jgi:type II secretion system protein I